MTSLADRALAALVSLLLLASPVLADDARDWHIQKLIACHDTPQALPLLLSLADAGAIDPAAPAFSQDGENCWRVEGGLDIAGIPFAAVCVATADPFLIRQFPDFFYRTYGTAPPEIFALISDQAPDELAAPIAATRGFYVDPERIEPDYAEIGRSRVACARF
ncbi:hypothetical protein [Cucumibacter marinus]|uniref:hypothetical protein n=1 Tax=Cucumibacter marinus TaxID=1121252 RepID=UPI00040FD6BC|nr:hypothetical protein [Cucumibacter marinus]